MNSEKLNSWLTLGANIGVLIGLVLLIVEIQQNTEMMRAQINQSRTEAAQSEQQATYNSDYMPAILTKVDKGEELTEEEMRRFQPYIRSFNRNMDNQLWQYKRGLLGENIPRSIRGAVRGVLGRNELTISVWDTQKWGYTDEYVAFVEDAISDLRSDENPQQ
jgi:hypothetical protein